jgi:hypothetical protein
VATVTARRNRPAASGLLSSNRTGSRLRAQEDDVSWAAADGEQVDMENIEVATMEEEEDTDSGPDFEEIIYSLDKSASVASLLSIVEQNSQTTSTPPSLIAAWMGKTTRSTRKR